MEQRDRHFEGRIVDAFLDHLDEARAIGLSHQDSPEDFENMVDFTRLPIPEL